MPQVRCVRCYRGLRKAVRRCSACHWPFCSFCLWSHRIGRGAWHQSTEAERRKEARRRANRRARLVRQMWLTERHERLQTQGRCVICTKRAHDDPVYCRRHRAWSRAYQRRRYQDRKARGLCSKCARPSLIGRTMCLICTEKGREWARRYRESVRAASSRGARA